ncbi:MAG: 50S ribosomal protein L29 [Chloroflexi bacterium]|jgi:large subunit ribosomal protein L29|nr:50S ribosomal protein L29 [Chloroflexota bacterium]
MKPSEIRNLKTEEVESKLADAREELMNFRFQQVSGQLPDPSKMRFKRRDIARMLTILNERKAEAKGEA